MMALPKSKPRTREQPAAEPHVQASPPTEPRLWTYEDYAAIPDDGYRYEVIWGKLYVAPAPNIAHQRSLGALHYQLYAFVMQHGLGDVFLAPTDVVLADGTVVQPDLLFVSKERAGVLTAANVRGAPDLVVEVLSPSTAAHDRGVKRDAYAAHGVPHYWMLAPATRSLEAYELQDGVYVLTGRYVDQEPFQPSLFPGLTLRLGEVWG